MVGGAALVAATLLTCIDACLGIVGSMLNAHFLMLKCKDRVLRFWKIGSTLLLIMDVTLRRPHF